ncbi:unnamed protein product [Peniophora sp. CBMAI 1063]|nr:unnamed protein product [Peniophora sp. CBMAI 1063]
MAIDGLIVLEPSGRPIAQTAFRTFSPAYPLLHIDAFNASPKDDPVIYVPSFEHGAPSACVHVRHNALDFLCPISGDIDPLYAIAFLRTFLDILADYFGDISPATLRDNFDILYQLLEETLDSGGHPLTTAPNALRDIVLPPTLFTKLLSAAGIPDLAHGAGPGGAGPAGASTAFSSPIPWRKAGLRYNANEIYFDIVETLRAVVTSSGAAVTARIAGRVDANARLSGTPDLALSFADPGSRALVDCAFHPCVRLARWTNSRVLSFVPPDGKFVLMEYALDTSKLGTAATAQAAVQVPLHIKAALSTHEHGGTFDVVLTSRHIKPLEDVVLELHLGESATSASCTVGSGAEWSYVPARQALRWAIPVVQQGSGRWALQGTFNSSDKHPRPARAIRASYSVSASVHSGLKVDQLKMTGETYRPYKGVRGRSDGQIEWRVDWVHQST